MSIFPKKKKIEQRTPDAGVWLAGYNRRLLPEWNLTDAIDAYEKNPIVYGCVRLIASEMARSALHLYHEVDGEVVEADDQPALKLLQAPNIYQSAYEFIEGLVTWQELTGEAPVYLNFVGKKPFEAFLLDPRYFEIDPDAKNYVKEYRYRPPQGGEITFTPEEIVLFRDFNPKSQYRGHAPIRSARYVVDSDQFAEEWNRDFFNNNAVPRAVVTSDNELSDSAFARLKATWNETFKGRGKNDKTAVLEGGAKVQVLSQTAKDMDFVSLGEKNIQRICTAFRVPKALLGIDLDLNRASAETMAYVFARWTIAPKLRALAEKLNNDYLPLFNLTGNGRWFFKFDDPDGVSSEEKNARYKTLFSTGAISPNEIRAEEGLPDIDGGEEPLVSAGMIPLSLANDIGEAIIDPDTDVPGVGEPDDKKTVDSKKKAFRLEGEKREAVRGIRDAKLKRMQRKYQLKAKSLFETQKKMTLDRLDRWYASKSIEKRAPQMEDLWEEPEAVALTMKLFEPLNLNLIKLSGDDTLDLITDGSELDYARARLAAKNMTIIFAKRISKTTEDALRVTIQQGIAAGEGAAGMADRVKKVFTEASIGRALVIGRTESTKAYSLGTLEGMKQGGARKKEWLTSHDDDVRTTHWENEFEGPIDINATFSNGCTAPGEGGPAGEVINCRCTLIPVIED